MFSWGHFLNVPLQQPNFFTYLAVETSLQSFHAKISILLHFPNHNWSIISRAKKLGKKILQIFETFPLALCSIGHLKPSFRPTFQETSQDGTFGYWSNSEGILLVASSSCPGSWIVLTLKGRWWCGKMRIHFFQFRCVTSSHLLRWLFV